MWCRVRSRSLEEGADDAPQHVVGVGLGALDIGIDVEELPDTLHRQLVVLNRAQHREMGTASDYKHQSACAKNVCPFEIAYCAALAEGAGEGRNAGNRSKSSPSQEYVIRERCKGVLQDV